MRGTKWLLGLMSGVLMAGVANGVTTSEADALWAKRGESLEAANAAYKAYVDLSKAPGATGDEKLYLYSQRFRMALFIGGEMMGQPVALTERKRVLQDCVDNVDEIWEDSWHQQYYYFKLSCLALRGKQEKTLGGRLPYAKDLLFAQRGAKKSIEDDPLSSFEGGGIQRILAAVRGNRGAKNLPGMYDPAEGVEFAMQAGNARSANYRPFNEAISGKKFYENAHYLGQARISLGIENGEKSDVVSGRATLVNGIKAIDKDAAEGKAPKSRVPEAKHYRTEMQTMINAVNTCSKAAIDADPSQWDAGWKACLIETLDKPAD